MSNVYPTLQHELHSKEKLTWFAQPDPNAFARSWSTKSLLGVMLFALTVYSVVGSSQGNNGSPFEGSIFLGLIGVGFILSPLWRIIAARWVFYGITNRRALIITTWPMHTVQSFYVNNLGSLKRKWMRPDGRGTLMFYSLSHQGGERTLSPNWGFYGIEDVMTVEKIIQGLT